MRNTCRWLVIFLAGFLPLFLLTACDEAEVSPPEKISPVEETARAEPLAQSFTITAQVAAKPRRTMLGGTVTVAAARAEIALTTVMTPPDAELPEFAPQATSSDGRVTFKIPALTAPGLYHFRFSAVKFPSLKPVDVFIYAGIEISGDKQDGWAKSLLENPIVIRATNADGKAAEKMEIAFDLRNAPPGTQLLANRLKTDADGKAELGMKFGDTQGLSEIGVRILGAPWLSSENVPDLKVRVFAIDGWSLLFDVSGGLAIFIFGMRLMSDGLTRVAGDRLRRILRTFTSNRFIAAAMGVMVTGFIQSSSACSVMVIGFVNAGLLALEQGIGVIIGANIGTTVTAQILSLKLDSLAYPAITIGVIYSLLGKKDHARFFAQILIGFGLLFLGMKLMGAPLSELRHSQFIHQVFSYLDCRPQNGSIPIGGLIKAILTGMIVTEIIQSSSAFIGILLALAGAGMLDVYTAFAVLLGSNIGTTGTALIATIGTTASAKRVACSHISFNLIGAILVSSSLYISWGGQPVFLRLVNAVTPGDAFAGENLPRFLANAHTMFNVFCASIFIWVVGPLAKLTRWIIPDATGTEENRFLEPGLASVPAVAMSLAWREIGVMVRKGCDALFMSLRAVFAREEKSEAPHDFSKINEDVRGLENDVDQLQTAIVAYVGSMTTEQTMTRLQSAALPSILHSVNDAERISDHAVHLLRLAKRAQKHHLKISEAAETELGQISEALTQLFSLCSRLIDNNPPMTRPPEMIKIALKSFHGLIDDAAKAHLIRQEQGLCDFRSAAIYQEILYNLHRVGSHLANIARSSAVEF